MKKIFTLLAFVAVLSLQSCTVSEEVYVDNSPRTEVFEVPTSFVASNNYSKQIVFSPPIYSSDEVLVYRLSGNYKGSDVWELLPESHYFNDGSFDFGYEFDYSNRDVTVYLTGSNLKTVPTNFRLDQILRVVIIPDSFAKSINKKNYVDVVTALNLKDDQIKTINF